MPLREPSYVERLNSLTAHFRNKVREALMREQMALLREGHKDAAMRLDAAMKSLLNEFPSVEEVKD